MYANGERMNDKKSVLVIGGKLFGLTIALNIKEKHPDWQITIVEKESFLINQPDKILDKSATLTSTKTLHSGTYYTHRGHSRGIDSLEQERLYNLYQDTRAGFRDVLEFISKYQVRIEERDKKCLYMCFKNAFIEPEHFEKIAKENDFYVEAVSKEKLKKLKELCTHYESEKGEPLELQAAFYTNDTLVDFVALIRNLEVRAHELEIEMIDNVKIFARNEEIVIERSNLPPVRIQPTVIINATGASTGPTAEALTAEAPPEDKYILQYRNIAWVDRKAIPIFKEIAQDEMSFFRFFQDKSKITFAEVMGDRSKICFYAPELIPVERMKPEDAFNHDPKKDPSLIEVARKYRIDITDPSFHAYTGLAAYTVDGRDLYHPTKTKTGIPVLNCLLEKMTSFVTASKRVAYWVDEKVDGSSSNQKTN